MLVIDNFSTGSLQNLAESEDQVRVAAVDIANRETIGLVADHRPDVIFHLAAQMDVRHSVGDPIDDARTNIIGLLHVLEGGRVHGVRKVVLASSGGTIYGEPDPSLIPIDETTPRFPLSPYGVAKVAGDLYLNVYRFLYDCRGTSLALGNIYGPRQDPFGEAGVVSIFAGALLAEKPSIIYGTGNQTRDFVYVDDAVEAFLCAERRGDGQLFNIGTGIETSISDLFGMLAAIIDPSAEPKWEEARSGELERSALNPALAQSELDWCPRVDLSEGLRRTVEWFKRKGV